MAKTISSSIGTTNSKMLALLAKLQSACIDTLLATGGLAIGVADKAKVKVVNNTTAFVDGKIVSITAAEVALSGTITDGNSNVYVIVADSSGTLSAVMGTESATAAGVVFPTIPADSCVLGWVLVATAAADFIGGTTLLDAGTATDTYVDTPFPFNSNAVNL